MNGKLHVYWGDGKGKTTAAMGLALRCLGHGKRVLIAQFMKTGNSGELIALRAFSNAKIILPPPISDFTYRMTPEQLKETKCQHSRFALELTQAIENQRPDLTVLDELGAALTTGLVGEDAARQLVNAALASGETVVTGYNAPAWLLDLADYCTHMQLQKHPFQTDSLPARRGIEW